MRVVCRRDPADWRGCKAGEQRTGGRQREERQRSRHTHRPPAQPPTTQRFSNGNNGNKHVCSLSHGGACENGPYAAAPCCCRTAGLWPAFLSTFSSRDRQSTKHTNAPRKSIRTTHHRRIQLVVYCACDCFVGWRRRLGRSAGLARCCCPVLAPTAAFQPRRALTHPQRRRERQHGLSLQQERTAATGGGCRCALPSRIRRERRSSSRPTAAATAAMAALSRQLPAATASTEHGCRTA